MRGKLRIVPLVALVAAGAVGLAAAGIWARGRGPDAVHSDSAPSAPAIRGVGESLLIVTAGGYPTKEDAERAARGLEVGELQGFYVDSIDNYEILTPGESPPEGGSWVLLSGFRTRRGAEEFTELVRSAGAEGLRTLRARKVGGPFIGLGQEPHPDGSGPLLRPLPNQEDYQR